MSICLLIQQFWKFARWYTTHAFRNYFFWPIHSLIFFTEAEGYVWLWRCPDVYVASVSHQPPFGLKTEFKYNKLETISKNLFFLNLNQFLLILTHWETTFWNGAPSERCTCPKVFAQAQKNWFNLTQSENSMWQLLCKNIFWIDCVPVLQASSPELVYDYEFLHCTYLPLSSHISLTMCSFS